MQYFVSEKVHRFWLSEIKLEQVKMHRLFQKCSMLVHSIPVPTSLLIQTGLTLVSTQIRCSVSNAGDLNFQQKTTVTKLPKNQTLPSTKSGVSIKDSFIKRYNNSFSSFPCIHNFHILSTHNLTYYVVSNITVKYPQA